METQASAARPNLAAVAALAGVSASTASLAFSGAGPVSAATKARVLAAAAQLDYAGPDPRAQSLRRGRSGIIGVVLEDSLSDAFRDPINIAMLDGLADEIGPDGSLLLLTGDNLLHSAPVDAAVLIGCTNRVTESVAVFRQRGVPVVAVEAEPMDGVLAIDLDNFEASSLLAQHLRDLGHTRIAMVTLPLEPSRDRGFLSLAREAESEAYTSSERIRGVRAVYPHATGFVSGASLVDEGAIAGAALLSPVSLDERPTAIIAQSDLLAVGVIRAAQDLGLRVPEDLSVVGFDGVRLDGIAPHDLTTMVQPAVDKGLSAGRAVVDLVEGLEPEPAWFDSEFHRGTTTAPPRR